MNALSKKLSIFLGGGNKHLLCCQQHWQAHYTSAKRINIIKLKKIKFTNQTWIFFKQTLSLGFNYIIL